MNTDVWREIEADSDRFELATGFSRCVGGFSEGLMLSPQWSPPLLQQQILPPMYDLWLGPYSILLRPQYQIMRYYRRHQISVTLPRVGIPFRDVRLMRFSRNLDGSFDKRGSRLAIEMVNGNVFLLRTFSLSGLWDSRCSWRLIRAFREVLRQQSGAFSSWGWEAVGDASDYSASRDNKRSFSPAAAEKLGCLENQYDGFLQDLRVHFPGELTTEGLLPPPFPFYWLPPPFPFYWLPPPFPFYWLPTPFPFYWRSSWRYPRSSSLVRHAIPLSYMVLHAWVMRAASPEESFRIAQLYTESTRLYSYSEGSAIMANVVYERRSGSSGPVAPDGDRLMTVPTRLPTVVSEREANSEMASDPVSSPPPSTPICQSPPQTPRRKKQAEKEGEEGDVLDPTSPTRSRRSSNPSSHPRLPDLDSFDNPDREVCQTQRWTVEDIDAAADDTDILRELAEDFKAERRNPSWTERKAQEKRTLRESELASALDEEAEQKGGGGGRLQAARFLCGWSV